LAIFILKIPQLGTEDVANALEWVLYVVFPNFCFSKALQDLNIKHQFASICTQIDEYVNRTTFCQILSESNQTNPCCPGKNHNVIHFYAFIHHSFVHESFIPSFVTSFIHSFLHPFTYSFIRPLIHSSIHSFIHSFVHQSIHSSIHSFIHSFLYLGYSSTHSYRTHHSPMIL